MNTLTDFTTIMSDKHNSRQHFLTVSTNNWQFRVELLAFERNSVKFRGWVQQTAILLVRI
jgi:hypothetical protein